MAPGCAFRVFLAAYMGSPGWLWVFLRSSWVLLAASWVTPVLPECSWVSPRKSWMLLGAVLVGAPGWADKWLVAYLAPWEHLGSFSGSLLCMMASLECPLALLSTRVVHNSLFISMDRSTYVYVHVHAGCLKVPIPVRYMIKACLCCPAPRPGCERLQAGVPDQGASI